MRKTVAALFAIGVLAPVIAFAQGPAVPNDAAAGGSASASASVSASTSVPSATAATPVVTVTPITPPRLQRDVAVKSETTDHESAVHRVAVGYLGASQVPIAQGAPSALEQGTVTAPTLGVRYWFARRVGIDLGLGLAVAGTSASETVSGKTVQNDTPPVLGFAIHAGLPIALAYSKHFTFEIIPEAHFAYAGTTAKGVAAAGGNPADIGLNGIQFDIGGRIGAEIHFGFIGIPQLSLQGSIGVSFRYATVWAAQGADRADASTASLATTIQNDPWAIFTNSVAALYYF